MRGALLCDGTFVVMFVCCLVILCSVDHLCDRVLE